MEAIKLKVLNAAGHTQMTCEEGDSISLVYTAPYQEGDRIVLECNHPDRYCMVQLEDSLPETLIYLTQREVIYNIPYGAQRVVFSPKCFTGDRHLIRARFATQAEISARRCLSCNPFDQHGNNGFFPHVEANVETRGEAVFAAQNAIDGVFENASHGEWPYASWGINRDPNAQWKLLFGRPVILDELRITLRADFPHDNYWTQATVAFSDGSCETLSLKKATAPQCFPLAPRTVEWLVLKDLIQADGPSPFPALTQLEAWGISKI